MILTAGTKVNTQYHGPLTIEKRLGGGGQGEVFLAYDSKNARFVVKWYFKEQATEAQKRAISDLISKQPKGEEGKRFIWPLDIVTASDNTAPDFFGYLMALIDRKRFSELGDVQSKRMPQPDIATLCKICAQAAQSYRQLHLAGYCYRDISAGNLMFDPKIGDVLICDNDNVGVNNTTESQVLGTWEYMAPEVILKANKPSTLTDLHSLAVLFFNMWMWHHPFHGDMESKIRSWDIPAKRKIYAEEPVFIFDPQNNANYPNDPDYKTVRTRWQACPPLLKDIFTAAFVDGLRSPEKRPRELDWFNCFVRMKDNVIGCPSCGANNIWDPAISKFTCWNKNCGKQIPLPPRLILTTQKGAFSFILKRDSVISKYYENGSMEDLKHNIAVVVQNPQNPSVWGLRNLTGASWQATMLDGKVQEVPPQRAVPLVAGIKFDMGYGKGEIQG